MSATSGFKRKQAFGDSFTRKRAMGEHAFGSLLAGGIVGYGSASLHPASASPMQVDSVHSVPAAPIPTTSTAHQALSVERPRPSGRPYRAWSSCIFGSEPEAWF